MYISTTIIGGILVLAACTDITVLDEALLRPGRLQHHIKLDLPNKWDIEEILIGRMKKMKCNSDVCVGSLGSILHNQINYDITGADVENVCRRALLSRIREEIKNHEEVSEYNKKKGKKDKKIQNIDNGTNNILEKRNNTKIANTKDFYTIDRSANQIDIGMKNFLEAVNECFPSFSIINSDRKES